MVYLLERVVDLVTRDLAIDRDALTLCAAAMAPAVIDFSLASCCCVLRANSVRDALRV